MYNGVMASKKITVDISHRTIIFTLFLLLAIVFFRHIAGVVTSLFIAFLISVAINPSINRLSKRNIPRPISAFIILFLVFLLLALLAASIISPLISETQNFIEQLPGLIDRLGVYNIDLSNFSDKLYSAPGSVLKIALSTFSGLIFFFTTIVISFYILADRPSLKKYLITLLGGEKGEKYNQIAEELEVRLGAWVRGELFLMFIVGLSTYIGLTLIGLPYAIPLAVIAGVLELVPNIGPTIAAVPAILVGFAISPVHGLITLGLSILIQQLENNLFVPKIMQQAVGLHPVVTIITLLIGFNLGGPLLAILALPIVLSIQVILPHFRTQVSDVGIKL